MIYIILLILLLVIILSPKEPKTDPFQKGDKVTAYGNVGEVKSVSENGMFVVVKFPEFDSNVIFNIDGRHASWCKEVSLRHV